MNTIESRKSESILEIKVFGAFNLAAKNMIKSRLNNEIKHLKIDFSECKLIDSEGVIFMHRWQNSGKELELSNPPEILFEILDILELKNQWNLTKPVNN